MKKYIPYGIIALLSTGLLFSLNKYNNLKNDIYTRQYDDTSATRTYNLLNQIVTEQEIAKANSQKQIKQLSEEVFKLRASDEKRIKQVEALIRIVQTAGVDTLYIPYDSTSIEDTSLVRKDLVVVPPRSFTDSTKDYQISGNVLLHGVQLDRIAFTDTLSFRIVDKTTGFLKPRKTVVQAVHSNPYYITNSMQSITVEHKTNAWNKWIKPAIAFAAGVFISSKL